MNPSCNQKGKNGNRAREFYPNGAADKAANLAG